MRRGGWPAGWQAARSGRRSRGGLLALRALRDASGAAFPLRKPDKVYGKIGTLEVRLTRRRRDIKLAQRLRYKVFYEEMSAIPTLRAELRRRDEDPYDAVCDHLLVIDEAAAPANEVVGRPAPPEGRRHLPRPAPGGRRTDARLLHAERIRHRAAGRRQAAASLHGARPLVRAGAVPQQADRRAAVARPVDLCARAQGRRDDRLRQPRRHRSRPARHGAQLPASQRPGAARVALPCA